MAEDIHARTALILYGSETGNSQDVAGELGRMAERLHFVARVSEMDAVDLNVLVKHRVVIFALSTTGQGEFPKNARKFWKSLLRKRLPPGCLGHVRFTTFGLGDSSYPKYNWAARKLHKRLEQLGAQEIYPRGEADEQHEEGIDGTFLSWKADFHKHLLSLYPLPEGVEPIPPEVLLPPKYTLQLVEGSPDFDSLALVESDQETGKSTTAAMAAKSTQELGISVGQVGELAASSTSISPSIHNENLSDSTANPEITLNMANVPPVEFSMQADLAGEAKPPPPLKEEIPRDLEPSDANSQLPDDYVLPIPDSFLAKLVGNKRITPESHWQDVRELTISIPNDTSYDPGDVLTLYPKNFPEDVQTLIDLMDWNDVADMQVTFEPVHPKYYAAEDLTSLAPGLHPLDQTTLRELLLHNLDITAIPKRYFFELIAHHTDDPMHKERLQEFANPIFIDEFFDYATRPRRSILEVLQEFNTVKLPWKWATSIFPVIRGRQYSISSGGALKRHSKSGDTKMQLLVAIVKYRTVLKKVRQGLCSRYIASLPIGTTFTVSLTSGTFSNIVKYHPRLPVLLVGPGTGVAPLRSLIWERAALKQLNSRRPGQNINVGETLLFYGGRNRNADYFYHDEWNSMADSLGLKVFTAFSRDQKEKIYVQDIIRKEKKAVWDVIECKAVIFVCGSSGSMPKAVREAIIDVMAEMGPFVDRDEAVEQLRLMELKGFYVQETW
ncbi:NADPH-dependent diflavin oxidoreductase 1 [Venustampulla echinocandica]|uniref:NADPH-dependent diflavin oxidoreductase 1 n=1 Tax=Venustampulla echinocandica TaxID=2656787 RepID=A0A370TBP9_9HELO|nr:NADPH-dependent diflavin oxidoreductase 1 [Venustampulla echinocandica]RDL31469.1 NADPH-dependent diflavin oxidoreductase 1 [Venustampulla echinocandica]